MAEISKIQGYDIKDATARSSVSSLQTELAKLTDGQSISNGANIDEIKDNGFYHQVGDWSGTLPTTYSGEWHYSNLLAFNAGVDVTVQMLFHFSRSVFALRTGSGSTSFTWQDWVVYNNPNDIASELSTINTSLSTKVNVSDVKDNLTSTDTNKPLSAKQGNVLKGLVDNLTPTVYTNITVDVTPTALSTYCDWDTEQKYGYSATVTVSGLTTNSLIQNLVMTDTLLSAVASVATTTTNGLVFYTTDETALAGVIYNLVTTEVEGWGGN